MRGHYYHLCLGFTARIGSLGLCVCSLHSIKSSESPLSAAPADRSAASMTDRAPFSSSFEATNLIRLFTLVPTRTGKPGKWEGIFRFGENHTKYLKTRGISDKCYLLFLVIFKLTVQYLLKGISFSVITKQDIKNTGKWKKILEKSGNLSPEK